MTLLAVFYNRSAANDPGLHEATYGAVGPRLFSVVLPSGTADAAKVRPHQDFVTEYMRTFEERYPEADLQFVGWATE